MVVWSDPAHSRFARHPRFIAQNSKFYAKKVLQDIVDKSRVLDALPRAGRIVPELSEPDIREISSHMYRVIYEVRSEDCYVFLVLHKRRDIQIESLHRKRCDFNGNVLTYQFVLNTGNV
jgi:toxin ParE1/3/4